ncbi:serine threonine kinase [Micractinium conductrix]|uniref:Serine threonine kinase n=1 Tax=Micractinium conductrix TaxID=554055 RepID=A0A2P6V061_9CHLO|nr:serine threonine kinase [Micractinium conductrix]|eukprot:PSC67486.1 serine threonine kinase [Micractinium conductrix]
MIRRVLGKATSGTLKPEDLMPASAPWARQADATVDKLHRAVQEVLNFSAPGAALAADAAFLAAAMAAATDERQQVLQQALDGLQRTSGKLLLPQVLLLSSKTTGMWGTHSTAHLAADSNAAPFIDKMRRSFHLSVKQLNLSSEQAQLRCEVLSILRSMPGHEAFPPTAALVSAVNKRINRWLEPLYGYSAEEELGTLSPDALTEVIERGIRSAGTLGGPAESVTVRELFADRSLLLAATQQRGIQLARYDVVGEEAGPVDQLWRSLVLQGGARQVACNPALVAAVAESLGLQQKDVREAATRLAPLEPVADAAAPMGQLPAELQHLFTPGLWEVPLLPLPLGVEGGLTPHAAAAAAGTPFGTFAAADQLSNLTQLGASELPPRGQARLRQG